jgi:hypothetical protein
MSTGRDELDGTNISPNKLFYQNFFNARRQVKTLEDEKLADGVGFEPTVGVNPRRFSRPLP